jgi:phage/plasmid-associated DNA primase
MNAQLQSAVFTEFLATHQIKKDSPLQITHTRIGDKDLNIYGGKYHIPQNELSEFWKLYYNHIFIQKNVEYLTEKQTENAFYVDLDFRYNIDVKRRLHTKDDIIGIMCCYLDAIKKFYTFDSNTCFNIFIFEKPNVNVLSDGSLTKDGIHMLFGIKIPFAVQLEIRKFVLSNIDKYNIILPLINTWNSVLDEGISKGTTNCQLYGSRKPANEAYELKYTYAVSYDDSDGEFMTKEMQFDIKNDFEQLSVQYSNNPEYPLKVKINTNNKHRSNSPTSVVDNIYHNNDIKLNESDIYYKYLNCIGNKMCDRGQHKDTITILQILKNEGLDIKYVEYWIYKYAYPNSKKYTYAIDYYNDDKFIRPTPLDVKNRLTIKSLKYYAKYHNPELYSTYFTDDYEWRLKKKYNNPEIMLANCDMEYEMMLEYYEMKKDKILYKDDKVYLYYNDEWNIMTEKGRMVKNDLVEFYYIWYKVALDLIHKEETKNLIEKNAEKDELIKKLRKIQSGGLRNTVGGTNINHIFNHLLNKLSCIKTEIEFDIGKENYYDINFKNGIYNVKTKNFRSRIQTDYITKYLDYDYIEPSQISQTIHNDVLEFFKKVQPNEEQRKFTLSYLAYCLTGDTTKQIFKMNIGHTASNGKSTEMSIHHKCFGIYTKKMDNRVLLTNFANRHKHIIDLVDEPVRIVYFEEMPKGKKLDVDFIKDFVDGKGVSCEIMFGTKADIKIQAKLLGVSNYDFEVDTDAGIIRRGRVQKYSSKFVDNGEDPINHIYKKVEGFENRFDDVMYKNAYFQLLLSYINDVYVPETNVEEFKRIAEEGDDVLNNIMNYFVITGNKDDKVHKCEFEKLGDFKSYKSKLQSKGIKYDSQGRVTGITSKGVFIGIRKLTDEELKAEDIEIKTEEIETEEDA